MGCCFVEASRTVWYAINGHRARFEIRADNSRFHKPFASLVAALRTQGLCKSYRNFLSRRSFCLGGIPGSFFRDGRVVGLSGLSRYPWIPPRDKRGIVWSGNRGLRFGIGADNGRIPMTLTCLRQRTCYSWEWSTVYRGLLEWHVHT